MADTQVIDLFHCDACRDKRYTSLIATCTLCGRHASRCPQYSLAHGWAFCRSCLAKQGKCVKCGTERFTPGRGRLRRRPSQLV